MNIWGVLRYDWTEPRRVRWSQVESNYCDFGTSDIRISPRDGRGSRVDVEIDHRDGRALRGAAILTVQRLPVPFLFPRLWKSALEPLAAEERQDG